MTVEPKVQSGEAADDYTPSTEDIQDAYKWLAWDEEFIPFDISIERFQRWLRKVKADLLKEIIHEVRDIPCWYPDGDPMGGEFDLDGESHRRFVLDTLLAYGSKLF